jgi:hypothetical protein
MPRLTPLRKRNPGGERTCLGGAQPGWAAPSGVLLTDGVAGVEGVLDRALRIHRQGRTLLQRPGPPGRPAPHPRGTPDAYALPASATRLLTWWGAVRRPVRKGRAGGEHRAHDQHWPACSNVHGDLRSRRAPFVDHPATGTYASGEASARRSKVSRWPAPPSRTRGHMGHMGCGIASLAALPATVCARRLPRPSHPDPVLRGWSRWQIVMTRLCRGCSEGQIRVVAPRRAIRGLPWLSS